MQRSCHERCLIKIASKFEEKNGSYTFLKFCQIDALSFKFLQAYPEEKSSGKSSYFFKKTKQKNYAQSKKLLVKIKFQAKF